MHSLSWPAGLRFLGNAGQEVDAPTVAPVLVVAFWHVDDLAAIEVAQVLGWLALCHPDRPLRIVAVHPGGDVPDERVARAAERLSFQVPVAIDTGGEAARAWGAGRLPSLWLGDVAEGERFRGAGVPDRARLERAVATLLAPLPLARGPHAPPCPIYGPAAGADPDAGREGDQDAELGAVRCAHPTALAFDASRDLWWIADGGPRPRLLGVELDAAGEPVATLRSVVGSGQPGSADGDPSLAAFAAPCGLAVSDGVLHVADLGNHLVRSVDPDHLGVNTLLGVGHAVVDPDAGRSGLQQGLASPMAVAELDPEQLVVAVAGSHQLWSIGRYDGYAEPLLGSGVPGGTDGMRYDASCTTPVAVAVQDGQVAFVEQATGAVRVLEHIAEQVWTWVPPGAGPRAPRAVAWLGGDLLVADPPTGRLLRVRGSDHAVEVYAGPEQGLVEPVAVAVASDGRVLVGDVGRGAVLLISAAAQAAEPLRIQDPHPETQAAVPAQADVAPGSTVSIGFPMSLPLGDRLHDEVVGHAWLLPEEGAPLARTDLPVEREGEWGTLHDLPVEEAGAGRVHVVIRFATCAEAGSAVHLQELRGEVDLRVAPDLAGPRFVDLHCR